MANRSARVDFAIITALEEERDAVLAKLAPWRKLEKDGDDTHTYYEATVASTRTDGATYRVIVTSLAAMGPMMATQKAQAIVGRWRPRYVLLVGIACGLQDETQLGDVLVATQVVDYVLGKMPEDGPRQPRWVTYPAGANLLDTAVNLAPDQWRSLITVRRPAIGEPLRRANVVASGGDVISNAEVMRSWKQQWPKLIGIEMEAGGIASGLHNTPQPPEMLMIKGVSDHGVGKERVEEWRPYAADAAASFALAIIRAGVAPTAHPHTRVIAAALAALILVVVTIAAAAWHHSAQKAAVGRLVDQGLAAVKSGDDASARRFFVAVLRLDATDAAAHANLGALALREGRRDEALLHAEAAVRAAPEVALYHYNLGRTLAESDRPEDALRSLERSIMLDRTMVAPYNELGNVYLSLRRPADARRVLLQGTQADPTFPPLWKNLARASIDAGRPAEALVFLARAAYPPSDWRGRAEVAYWTATAFAALRRDTDACAELRVFDRLDPDHLSTFATDAQTLARTERCTP